MINYFPKYFTNKAIGLYMAVLFIITLVYMQYSMPWYWLVFGIVEVICFFYFGNVLTKKWARCLPKAFAKKIFWTSFIITFIYVVITYFLYIYLRGEPFEYDPSDGTGYHAEAKWFVELFREGKTAVYWNFFYDSHSFSDTGYQYYLNFLYVIIDSDIFITRVLKCIYRAWMCVLVYKLSARTFGESTGRMAAIFCMLMPNFSFYACSHRKEMEMVFLTVLFMERADAMIRNKTFNLKSFLVPLLLLGVLFSFRTVLGIAAVFAFCSTLLLSDKRMISKQRRWVILLWFGLCGLTVGGGAIMNEVEVLWENKMTNQTQSMEWRAKRKGGNEYSKYATGAIFAPAIVILPFPTMMNIEGQGNQQRLNGGYFIRNFLAFFVLFFLFVVIKQKKWRDFVLIETFTFSYLIIIALSAFAQSERFHLPALPFLLILASFGVSIYTKKEKKYLNVYSVLIFFIIVAWTIFKLGGRGLI